MYIETHLGVCYRSRFVVVDVDAVLLLQNQKSLQCLLSFVGIIIVVVDVDVDAVLLLQNQKSLQCLLSVVGIIIELIWPNVMLLFYVMFQL